jgi:hypothetical protein
MDIVVLPSGAQEISFPSEPMFDKAHAEALCTALRTFDGVHLAAHYTQHGRVALTIRAVGDVRDLVKQAIRVVRTQIESFTVDN